MAIEKTLFLDEALGALQNQQLTTLTLQAVQKKEQDPNAKFKANTQQSLSGHTSSVYCVAVLPDGRVASGSTDKTLKVWDVKTGQCMQTLSGHKDTVRCVAVLPDGRVVSGSGDNTLRVWDMKTGTCVQTLSGHKNTVFCVAVLPDGRVVSSSSDNTLKVWDMKTGTCVQTLSGHTSSVYCVAVLPDGRVVSSSSDNTLKVWEEKEKKGWFSNSYGYDCVQTLSGHKNTVFCVAVLADGRVISGSLDSTLKVWDAQTGQCVQTLSRHEGFVPLPLSQTNLAIKMAAIECVALLSDGRVVSGSWAHTPKVWDLKTGQCVQTLSGHKDTVFCVAVLPDGRVVSGSSDNTLKVWEPEEKVLALTPQDQATLLTAVQNNTSLMHLNLSQVALADIPQGVNWLMAIVEKHPLLESLDLSETGLTDAMFYKLFRIVCTRKRIEHLNVERNPLLSQSVKDQVNAYSASFKMSPPIQLIPKEKPESKPYLEKSWHFDPLTERTATLPLDKDYALLPATDKDIQKVISFYQHHPVSNYEVGKVEVIYNRGFNQAFEVHLRKLQKHHNNPAFIPKWSSMSNPDLRRSTIDLFTQLTMPYTDPDYAAVKLLPAWHGTKPQVLDSIFSAGYANLAITDNGYFGKGYYSAYEAEYSYRVYAQGALILNWVASFSPLPVVDKDMDDLKLNEGKSNYGNYDAHFVPVKPRSPDNPDETVYYPCQSLDERQYTEMVVFESAALLPRYLVELQPMLIKPIPSSTSSYPSVFFPSVQQKEEEKQPGAQQSKFNVFNIDQKFV